MRKHWREIITGGVFWVDGYNKAIHRKTTSTITARVNDGNHFVIFSGNDNPKQTR